MTKVKICGITNLPDALLSVKLGADALGFNFYERSPRHITLTAAKEIIDHIPRGPLKVGVFVNERTDIVAQYARDAGLDAAQLHGDEDQLYIERLKRATSSKVIKAFRVNSEFDRAFVAAFDVDGVLLDTYSAETYGGTGSSFDWDTARSIKELVWELYLAGGLTPENVAVAVATVRPYGVDVASGVESSPGHKDPRKLEAFIENAKKA